MTARVFNVLQNPDPTKNPSHLSPRVALSLLYLSLAYCAPTIAMILWCIKRGETAAISMLLLCWVLLSILFGALLQTWGRFFLVQFPLLLLSIAFAAYAVNFAMIPGETLAILTVGASVEEVIGLIRLWPEEWLLIPAIIALVIYTMLAWRLRATKIVYRKRAVLPIAGLLLAAPCVGVLILNPGSAIGGFAFNPMTGSIIFLTNDLPRAYTELHGGTVVKQPFFAIRDSRTEEIHILVVGESARRASWSAYGYTRPTTPILNRLKSEVVLLSDAMADANLTNYSVEMMLTGMRPDEALREKPRSNLLDLAAEAGYETFWLVNQDINISTAIGVSPQHLDIPPDLQSNFYGRGTCDEVLLPLFRREIARADGASKFIGIHIMGSHWEYYRRYPPAFAIYGNGNNLNPASYTAKLSENAATSLLNTYDNSIQYTDWFLGQLIDSARSLRVPVTITYFPDHGEQMRALDGASGHGQSVYAAQQYEIPAFVWMNEDFKSRHPEMAGAIRTNSTKEIRTHNVFYAEAELMGVKWPGNHATLSFASVQFEPDVSKQHIAGGLLVTRP